MNRPAGAGSPRAMSTDHQLRATFDQPSFHGVIEGEVRFAGWCFHTEGELRDLKLTLNGHSYPARFAMERLDVGRAFPGVAAAEYSGFVASIPLQPGRYKVALEADVVNVGRQTFEAPETLVVKRRPLRQRLVSLPTAGFANFAVQRARKRFASGRGWPRWTELPVLFREAYQDYVLRSNARLRRGIKFTPPPKVDAYAAWLGVNEWSIRRESELRDRLATEKALPKISIVTPVFRPYLKYFAETVASVRNQVYDRWEWCLADDASGDTELSTLLQRLTSEDNRIRVVTRQENGHISRATNSAAELATGEFLAFLDHDDLLTPDALGEVALHLAANPDIDVLYSDDDKIDTRGQRYEPQFKPAWSPESLLSQMYMSHLLVVRRSLFEAVGGFRIGFEGSQDHDLALRATEKARRVAHLPYVLYHWRAVPGSLAASVKAKDYSLGAGLRAVKEALERRNVPAVAETPEWAVSAGLGVIRHRFPDHGPSVAIIIATRNRVDLLRRCLASLEATTYKPYHVTVIDDHSDDPETIAFLSHFDGCVLRKSGPRESFNFAALHNHAAREVTAEYLLFLNNDTEVRSPDWLSQMVGFARLSGVGAVGARLLYEDQSVQHAGIIHGFSQGSLALPFRNASERYSGYLSAAKVCRNYSAVTAACMLTPRSLFLEVGGFDEDAFPISFNDVDYCYRLVDRGYRCVYAPEAELFHHEGASRGLGSRPAEIARFRDRYRNRQDPYLNPNFSPAELFTVQKRRLVRRPSGKVRAVMFTNSLNLTGAPWCQLELTLELTAHGVLEPLVFSLQDGPLRAMYEQAGIPVEIYTRDLPERTSTKDYEAKLSELSGFIRSARPDLVYGNTLDTFMGIDAGNRLGLPSIWNIRESEPWETYFHNLPDPAAQAALNCFQYPYRVIFVSNASRRVFEQLNTQHNFCVIHDGVGLQEWKKRLHAWTRTAARNRLHIEDSDVVVLIVGTVCERKGQHDLVRAISRIRSTAGRLRCFIVGDRPGEYSRDLKALIQDLPAEISNRITVVKDTQDVSLYYQSADIFVCTSRFESYPRVTLEAMACGLPIISTPVFGLAEQLRNGFNAIFYEPGDTVALAAALEALLNDGALRARMGKESRLVVQGLESIEDMAEEYGKYFREAADSRQ